MNIATHCAQSINQIANTNIARNCHFKSVGINRDTFKRTQVASTAPARPLSFKGEETVMPYNEMDFKIRHSKFLARALTVFKYSENGEVNLGERGSNWITYFPSGHDSSQVLGWKFHIYADEYKDWQNIAKVVMPYLVKNKVCHKTFGVNLNPNNLTGAQKGKSFTIYPASIEQMKEIMAGVDKLLEEKGLTKQGASISGDRAIGSSGRLFYRYELNSGEHAKAPVSSEKYHELYENRGDGSYLASDMTTADDPFYNFNP